MSETPKTPTIELFTPVDRTEPMLMFRGTVAGRRRVWLVETVEELGRMICQESRGAV